MILRTGEDVFVHRRCKTRVMTVLKGEDNGHDSSIPELRLGPWATPKCHIYCTVDFGIGQHRSPLTKQHGICRTSAHSCHFDGYSDGCSDITHEYSYKIRTNAESSRLQEW